VKRHSGLTSIIIVGVSLLLVVFCFPIIESPLYEIMDKTNMQKINDYELSLPLLTWQHLKMSFSACLFSILIGLALGVFASVGSGRQFRPVIEKLVMLSNALPAIGLLAIFIPIFGFGVWAGVIPLLFCGTMPIVFNTMTGLDNVPNDLVEVGEGLGMTKLQVFLKIKIAMSFPILVAGLRASAIIIIGLATLTAISGAGGLGVPIFESGIRGFDPVMLIKGTLPVCLLALFVDRLFGYWEERLKIRFSTGVSLE
jgi:osmoprotectant transport system permease protein